jgi:hypothetical protein
MSIFASREVFISETRTKIAPAMIADAVTRKNVFILGLPRLRAA